MLTITKASVGYGKKLVLSDINLKIDRKGIIGIKGKNGSGKSTLLKSIVGQADIIEGEIIIMGNNIINLPTHQIIKMGISYVSQEGGLFPDLTIEEHFNLLSDGEGNVKTKKYTYSEHGWLKDVQHKKVGLLSGGQQRMLSILLLHFENSSILILDEPTAGLDFRSVRLVEKLLIKLKYEYSILLSEQNQNVLNSVCDMIYEINEGGKLIVQQ